MRVNESTKQALEYSILDLVELVSEDSYEKYLEGELAQQELHELYDLLSTWTLTGKKLLQNLR
jgi:hypothetical protein